MKCKDITEKIDLGTNYNFINLLRYYGHLAFCKACRNYLATSRYLQKISRQFCFSTPSQKDLSSFNQKLKTRLLKNNLDK